MTESNKILLSEKDIPEQWYNIQADMPNPCLPALDPETGKPLGPEALAPIFPEALIKQEISNERFIHIPEEVREVYKLWRPTPLYRAYSFERLLDTPAKIYYK